MELFGEGGKIMFGMCIFFLLCFHCVIFALDFAMMHKRQLKI